MIKIVDKYLYIIIFLPPLLLFGNLNLWQIRVIFGSYDKFQNLVADHLVEHQKGNKQTQLYYIQLQKKRSWIIWIQINYQKRNCLQSQVGHFVSWQHWITVLFSSPQSCTGVSAKSWSMNCPKFISNAVFDLDIKSDED